MNDASANIIVGLGNVGEEYKGTRHNAGFLFLDHLLSKLLSNRLQLNSGVWKNHKYLDSHVSYVRDSSGDLKLIAAKPTTMMNLSGVAVKKLMKRFKIFLDDLVLVYDDLDIKIGGYKISQSKFPRDHKGVNDVVSKIGSSNFTNIRIGIDGRKGLGKDSESTDEKVNNSSRIIPGEKYVLLKFNEDELVTLYKVFDEIIEELMPKLT